MSELVVADNEPIASILLKLEQLPDRDVAILAAPKNGSLRNPVSMRLLQRKAEDLGLDISVVSQDDMTRQLCAEIGFGCYPSLESYQQESGAGHSPREWVLGGRLAWASAVSGLCLLALASLIAYFVLPAATITLVPASKTLSIDVPVVADVSNSSVDPAAGRIPARTVVQEVAGSTNVRATGQRDVPDKPATGVVVLTNLTDQPLTVPKSTILLAGKVAFSTTQDAHLEPSIRIADTSISGSATVPVQAVDPGEDGNVKVGAITAVQGPLASKVSVINKAATTGGTKKKAAFLSSDDQAKAKSALLEDLRQRALEQIKSQIARNETFLPSPASMGEDAIQQLTFEESPEQVTTQTRVNMRVLVRGLSFQGDDVNQVVAQAMDNAVQRQGAGARLSNAALAIEPPVVLANDGVAIRLQVRTTGQMVSPVDAAALADRVRGMPLQEALSELLKAPGVGQADVQLWPVWASRVPSFSCRIHTRVAAPPA